MFPSSNTPLAPPPAQRLVGALRLIRSFLLLEDDYDVDWEVDRDELANRHQDGRERARTGIGLSSAAHLHREPLRANGEERRRRRAGAVAGPDHVCLCALSDGDPSVDRRVSVSRSQRRRRTERGDRTSLGGRG
jgi:hypothetical protein